MSSLPDRFEPGTAEKAIYQAWLDSGVFSPDGNNSDKTFTMVMPPPNVTGVLHIGHALTSTIEDVIIRRKRMQGFKTLWLPGTDHAGIATQMVVERNIQKSENKTKHDLGREAFLERVWAWKEQSQDTILGQLRKIGCSADWSRLAFTLDEGPALAVRQCFFQLYQDGLMEKRQAMIQWCPRCRTALSDLEVKSEPKKTSIWYLRYRLATDPTKALIVATTRPETLLGDTAVAVHPEDDRFLDFHGQNVLVPLADRPIPVITDPYVDREFGTGALKITPAHDPNDYEIGKKHKLPSIEIFDERAHLKELAGDYAGLSREEARKKILKDLDSEGLLEKEEPHQHNVGHCDRCKTVVEPKVSQQWFVDAAELAKPAIKAVESGELKIIPKEWEKTYFEWMRNIRPWCISRQLWWGHRIPVWYCQSCSEVIVAVQDPTKCSKCGSAELKQDEDVLDTWFSSGLWPFSTLGWPNQTEDLKDFYPNDVLETGFDILFFWVARMVMLGIHLTGKIPFHTVYLHPMVRDEFGKKMSKTKGNVKDPLDIIETMGADSLRLYFCLNAYHGRDVRVTDSGLEGSRNFVNKLWNASRFVLMHFGDVKKTHSVLKDPINAWIWAELERTKAAVNEALDEYRFFEAANLLYHFTWDTYCSSFIELIKNPKELEKRKKETDSTAVEVLEELLRLLHPMMPFVTEAIWGKLPLKETAPFIAQASYPKPDPSKDTQAGDAVVLGLKAVEAIRTQRGIFDVSPNVKIRAKAVCPQEIAKTLESCRSWIEGMGGVAELDVSNEEPDSEAFMMSAVTPKLSIYILKEDLGDVRVALDKMKREAGEMEAAIKRAKGKLANASFVNNAPPEVVEGVKAQCADLEEKFQTLSAYLKANAG